MKKVLSVLCFVFFTLMTGIVFGAEKRPLNAENTGAALQFRGNALYVCTSMPLGKVAVFDLSSPDRPVLKAQYESKFYPCAMAFNDKKELLVVDAHDLLTFDISNPNALKLVSKKTISEDPVRGPVDILLQNGKVLLACRKGGVIVDGKQAAGFYARTLAAGGDDVFAAGPKTLSNLDTKQPLAMSLFSGTPVKLRFNGDKLYLAQGFHGISVFQILNQGTPVKSLLKVSDGDPINQFSAYGTFVYDMAFDAKNMYAAAGETGVVSAEISADGKIKYLALCKDLLWHTCSGLAIQGKLLYVFDRDLPGLCVLDITDPFRMKVIHSVKF